MAMTCTGLGTERVPGQFTSTGPLVRVGGYSQKQTKATCRPPWSVGESD
jgi:hypothetical protein